MTDKETRKYIAEMKRYTANVSTSEARKLLVKAGICTKKGNLRKPYR